MSLTQRHHFIPVFYLKQFTNERNQFYIYLTKENKFKDNGRLFYPSQQFYQHYGNTVYSREKESDFIEQSFSDTDSRVATIIKKISASGGQYLTSEEWTLLQYFVNIMHWRIPSNTDKVKEYIANAKNISDFRMKLTNPTTGQRVSDEEEARFIEKIKQDAEFPKFLKLMLPKITYPEIFEKDIKDSATIISVPLAD